jgi:hypothetical protein
MYGRTIMAGRLLCGALAALLVQGCLLPQDDQVLPLLPPAKNTPPRIFSAKPEQTTTLTLGDRCPRLAFSVLIEDRDVDPEITDGGRRYLDVLRHRWFVDDSKVGVIGRPFEASATAIRAAAAAPELLFSAGSALAAATPNPHKLTVVVSDGEFGEGKEPRPGPPQPLPDGGRIEQQTYTDEYTWLVTTDLSPCP